MFEALAAALLLTALAVLVCRKGHRHLLRPRLPWGIALTSAAGAWMLEALPLTPFRAGPSVMTLIAVGCGLFAGRLVGRGIAGWAQGQERDVAAGTARADQRMLHPLFGIGFVLFGAPLLYTLAAMRHETLETLAAPRSAETGVVLGAEEVRLDGDPSASHAVVLVHGYLGSPADFGDVPERLRAAGLTVRAVRLPGHGTWPGALADVSPEAYDRAVADARADLAKSHARVSLVGFSFGAALAVRSAAEAPPHRLALVNPWLGATATPSWSPFATDALLDLAAKVLPRVIRPPGLTRVNEPGGMERMRTYWTVRPAASVVAREVGRGAASAEVTSRLASPTLLLLSTTDRTVPPEPTLAWFGTLPEAASPRRVVRLERSDHLALLDYDREAATAALIEFLTR